MTPITWYLYGRNGGAKKAAEEIGVKGSVSGDIASFSDGADNLPVDSLVAEITPVQDLHGQANPYPAGGGKNLLVPVDMINQTLSGVTFSIQPDGVHANGTATEGLYYNIINRNAAAAPYLDAGTYTLSKSGSTDTNIDVRIAKIENQTLLAAAKTSPTTFTLTERTQYFGFIYIPSGTTLNNVVFTPQIEKGSTATAYAPYSNICPISGRTGLTVTRSGKNLIDDTDFRTYTNWSDSIVNYGAYPTNISNKGYLLNVVAGTTYTLSLGISSDSFPTFCYLCRANGIDTSERIGIFATSEFNTTATTFTAEKGCIYFVRIGSSSSESRFDGQIDNISYIQLEIGSTATAYEPYHGATYPVTWETEAGTVYGGTLDVVSGVLTVTDAQIASYAGETLPGEWISDRDVYVDGTTPTTGAQVVYKLATPQTYQLTPTEVRTILGGNTIYTDAGDVSVEYIADTKLYIDNKIAELQALILEN